MSTQEKRSRNSVRISSKSPIATPPRAALSGRSSRVDSKPDRQSTESSPDGTAGMAAEPKSLTSGRPEQGDHSTSESEEKNSARVAHLEREMAIMEDEFARELEQLGEKLTNEAEMSIYWQQKHSALNQQFLKTDTELRMLRHEIGGWEKLREDKDRDVKTRISSLMLDRDTLRESYQLMKADMKQRDEDIMKLRSQVKGLKDFVSTSSRTDDQITDEVFGEMMQRLGNGIQNWVIQNFRKAKLDLAGAKEEIRELMLDLVPTYESQVNSAKIHLIQSLLSRLLITSIFTNYFVGLPDDRASELRNLEKYLGTVTGDGGKVNLWRSTTLVMLRSGPAEQLQSATDAIIDSIIQKINTITNEISDVSNTEIRDQSLRALIISAVDLSRLLRVQKAIFRPIMPMIEAHQINTFDAELMEDIGGEDEDSLEGREIRCVTFFGMVKEGDESGEQIQLRNVISKARVLCEPD